MTLLAALGLAGVHVLSHRLTFLDVIPRSRFLSASGGVAAAYVFVRLIPELGRHQEVVAAVRGGLADFFTHHVYLLSLAGLVVFYGLERAAIRSRKRAGNPPGTTLAPGFFWLHSGSFALYNVIIGYVLVHRERPGILSLFFFFSAMLFHFVAVDFGLHKDHRQDYDRVVRWILSAAVMLGWGLGMLVKISDLALAVVVGFLSGAIILNALKEELPEERQSRFWPFALGAAGYAALLLWI